MHGSHEHGRHEKEIVHRERPSPALIVFGVVMLMVMASVVFSPAGRLLQGGSGEATAQATGGSPAGSTPSSPAAVTATATAVDTRPALVDKAEDSCRLNNLRQQSAMSAAAVSLAQWQKHIDAMNLLVAGKISLDVATTFWEQTRVAAMENVDAFFKADKAVGSSGAACKRLTADVASVADSAQEAAIASCAATTTVNGNALRLARVSVTTWEHHVHDMERLRRGEITPAQATAAWLKSWKSGERELRAYDAAVKTASKARCPLG